MALTDITSTEQRVSFTLQPPDTNLPALRAAPDRVTDWIGERVAIAE